MKTGNALKKYFSKRADAIDAFLEKPEQAFTPEDFHELRVEIKKLKAFFELINFCAKDFQRKKTFKTLKTIFVQAGKVRELQLEEAALKKYAPQGSLVDYMDNLKKNCLKEQKFFFSLINKELLRKLEKNDDHVAPFVAEADKNCVNIYLDKKREKIELLLKQKDLKAEDVHELRKRLKEIYYIRKCVDLKGQNKLLKKTEPFQELLGQWHDCIVVDGHLKKAIDEGGMNPEEIKLLEKIKTKLFSEGELLFEKINVEMQELTIR